MLIQLQKTHECDCRNSTPANLISVLTLLNFVEKRAFIDGCRDEEPISIHYVVRDIIVASSTAPFLYLEGRRD